LVSMNYLTIFHLVAKLRLKHFIVNDLAPKLTIKVQSNLNIGVISEHNLVHVIGVRKVLKLVRTGRAIC